MHSSFHEQHMLSDYIRKPRPDHFTSRFLHPLSDLDISSPWAWFSSAVPSQSDTDTAGSHISTKVGWIPTKQTEDETLDLLVRFWVYSRSGNMDTDNQACFCFIVHVQFSLEMFQWNWEDLRVGFVNSFSWLCLGWSSQRSSCRPWVSSVGGMLARTQTCPIEKH